MEWQMKSKLCKTTREFFLNNQNFSLLYETIPWFLMVTYCKSNLTHCVPHCVTQVLMSTTRQLIVVDIKTCSTSMAQQRCRGCNCIILFQIRGEIKLCRINWCRRMLHIFKNPIMIKLLFLHPCLLLHAIYLLIITYTHLYNTLCNVYGIKTATV
jgi:hypothetical protein